MTEPRAGGTVRYFVVIAGRTNQPGSRIYVVGAHKAKEAHRQAEADYRRVEGLRSNVFVQTATAADYPTEAEAVEFVNKLEAAMNAAEEADAV